MKTSILEINQARCNSSFYTCDLCKREARVDSVSRAELMEVEVFDDYEEATYGGYWITKPVCTCDYTLCEGDITETTCPDCRR